MEKLSSEIIVKVLPKVDVETIEAKHWLSMNLLNEQKVQIKI